MKRLLVSTFSTTALAVLLSSGVASAHFNLMSPTAADNATDGGKGAPPCGPTSASNAVTSVQGGQELPIQLSETIMHPGHYRIALAATPAQIPADPAVQTDNNNNSLSATIETTGTPGVLVDDVFDHTTGNAPIAWNTTVKIPNVNCDSCTLQIIEFMAEHSANPGGGYYYHHCATLKISADMTQPLDSIPGISGSSDGAMAGTAGSGSMPPAMMASGGAGGASSMAPAPAAGGTSGSGMAAATPPSGSGQTASASGGTMTAAPSSNATGMGVASAATPAGAPAGMAAMTTGSTSAMSNALAPAMSPQSSSDDGGGCALSPAASRSSAAGGLALLALSLGWVGRRRR